MDRLNIARLIAYAFAFVVSACAGPEGSALQTPSKPSTDHSFTQSATLASAAGGVWINSGGAAVGTWLADTDYSSATWSHASVATNVIDTSRVSNPAPQSVYQSQRYGPHLKYVVPNLSAGVGYNVTLDFVESFWTGPRKRLFTITINGTVAATSFDIYAAAGATHRVTQATYARNADSTGKITIQFDATHDNASIAGIEVVQVASAPAPAPSPTAPPAAPTYADANLPPSGWQFPFTSSPFSVPVCSADPCTPALDPNSASEVNALAGGKNLDLGDIYEGYPNDNDFPVYYAAASDPLYTVTCDRGGCGTGTISVNIPNGAYPSQGSDHHLSVINTATGVETDLWEFNDRGTGTGSSAPVSGGGSLSAASGGVCRQASFTNRANTCAGSSTGSGLPIQPLVLDPREILSGRISHTLYVAVGCGQRASVFPASASDGACPAGPKYGQRIWLDLSDAQSDALNDATWAKTMLHAMHHYGWTISDSNGSTSGVAFANLAPQTFTMWGKANPWTAFFAAAGGIDYVTIPTAGISQADIHIVAM